MIISKCVLNLAADKGTVLAEAFRVLLQTFDAEELLADGVFRIPW